MQPNVKGRLLYLGTACLTFILGTGLVTLWTKLRSQSTPNAQYADSTQKVDSPVRCAQSPVTNSPIRNVDFENLRYQGKPVDLGLYGGATYYDVTGDGIEDAIVGFHVDTYSGTAIVCAAYIYTLQHGRAVLLWDFEAGDRADGGLRSVYGQNGELVIELQGKDKVIGKDLYASDDTSKGLCCPSVFTRTRYRWNGRRFVQKGESEVLPLAGAPETRPFQQKFLSCNRE